MRLNCEKNYPKINKLFSLTSKILGCYMRVFTVLLGGESEPENKVY